MPEQEPSQKPVRIHYLLSCYRTACDQLVFRIEHRDQWLKTQLLVQAAFLALASGIEFGGVKATSPAPTILALAIPTSLVLTALYVLEDRIISHEVQYIASLSAKEAELSSSPETIHNLESSPEIQQYIARTLPIRLIAQMSAFLLIPAGSAVYRFVNQPIIWNMINSVEVILDVVLWIASAGLLLTSYLQRRKAARDSRSPRIKAG